MRKYLNANIAEKTAKIYRQKHNAYKKFCKQLLLLRYSQKSISMYASHLADFNTYSYIIQCITAIKYYMKRVRKPRKMLHLKQVLAGIKRCISNHPVRPTRLPITPQKLTIIKRRLRRIIHNRHDRRLLWCACLFAYFGFLRVSEYTNPKTWTHMKESRTLTWSRVTIKKNHIFIVLKKSKTDQTQHGTTVTIATNNTPSCPIKAYNKYIKVRGEHNGPFFQFKNRSFLTPQRFNKVIKKALPAEAQGVYTSHSFRIGAASTAAAQNYPNYIIQQLGRWTSDAYMRYIKINQDFCTQVSHDLA